MDTINLSMSITPEAKALVETLRTNNDRLAECMQLLNTCKEMLRENHASVRQLPAEFLKKVGFESPRDLEVGIVDEALPAAGAAADAVVAGDHP